MDFNIDSDERPFIVIRETTQARDLLTNNSNDLGAQARRLATESNLENPTDSLTHPTPGRTLKALHNSICQWIPDVSA
jgi:hypothetical protein